MDSTPSRTAALLAGQAAPVGHYALLMEQDWNHFWTGAFLVIAVFGAGCWALLREGTYTRRREVRGWWIVALMSCLLVASLAYGWAAGAAGQGDTAEALGFTAIGLTVILFVVVRRLRRG